MDDTRRAIYQSMPINVYHSLNYSDRFSSIKLFYFISLVIKII